MAIEPASSDFTGTVEMRNVISGKQGGKDVADDSSDGVLGKDIEGIVDSDDELQLCSVIACRSTDDTEDDCRPCRNLIGNQLCACIYRLGILRIQTQG